MKGLLLGLLGLGAVGGAVYYFGFRKKELSAPQPAYPRGLSLPQGGVTPKPTAVLPIPMMPGSTMPQVPVPGIPPTGPLGEEILQGYPPKDGVQMLGDPMHLDTGARYRGVLDISRGNPFGIAVPDDVVKATLEGMGFANVKVYANMASVPRDWQWQPTDVTTNIRWVEGNWGQAPADNVHKTEQVVAIWKG